MFRNFVGRRSFLKIKLAAWLSLLGVAATLTVPGCDKKNPDLVNTPPPTVMVSHPVERTVTDYEVFTARTQAVQSVEVKARVTGYLNKILFKDGTLVEADKTVLFEIDDRPYKATLDQAKAALEVANSDLQVAKAGLEIAKAALVKTQADYEIGVNVKKTDPGAISDQEIVKRLGARDESKGGIDKAKAAIEEAKGVIDKSKANLENAQLYFDWCKVRAPISGRITRHFVDVGNMVNQDTTDLANIVSLKPMWAYINVDQNTVLQIQALVREGKVETFRSGKVPANMSVGVGSDETFPFAGTIDYTSPALDPNTGTVQVRCVFPNEDEKLVSGLFGRIQGPIGAPHPALLVADRAVGTDQGQRYILVVNDKDEVEYRPVDVGQVHDGLREVKRFRTKMEAGPDGKEIAKQVEVLKPTDLVIVLGLQRARPGDKVAPKLVDMQTLLTESATDKKSTPPGASK